MAQTAKQEILEYWILTIPNQGNPEKTIEALRSNVESRGGKHYALDKLPIQRLKVGTLDKLHSKSSFNPCKHSLDNNGSSCAWIIDSMESK